MSTTTNLSVIKGFPYQVRARAEGYFDLEENYTFTEDGESITKTMTAYNGLDMSYEESYQSADKVDFSNTVLPWKWQYSTALTKDRYCLMPTGQNYENVTGLSINANFDIVGDLTLDFANQTVEGFSTDNYVKLQTTFPHNTASSWEMVFKVYPRGGGFIFAKSKPNTGWGGLWIVFNGTGFEYYLGNGQGGTLVFHEVGSNTTNLNTWVYVKFEFTGSAYKGYISSDGVNWTPDMTFTSSSKIAAFTADTTIGRRLENDTPFNGIIDFSESFINVNGSSWLQPAFYKASSGVTETLPGCTYNFTDDGSATTLNCFAVNGDEGIVLTPDNSYNIPAQQGGFFNGAIFFSHNPEVELGFLGVYDSNGDLKWKWDGNYNVVGDLFVSENEEGIVTTAGYENGSYIETQDAFTFEPGDKWEAGVRFLCLVIGSQQTVMSSKGFELGVDQNGHPYGTFYGVGTITLTDITLGLGDEADISCWYSDDNDGYGFKYHLQSTLLNRAGHAEDVMLNSAMVESGEKVSFGCFQISGEQNGWLLGTVSIPSHTVYTYEDGTWTEAKNA